jgi:hypothetical protein
MHAVAPVPIGAEVGSLEFARFDQPPDRPFRNLHQFPGLFFGQILLILHLDRDNRDEGEGANNTPCGNNENPTK